MGDEDYYLSFLCEIFIRKKRLNKAKPTLLTCL